MRIVSPPLALPQVLLHRNFADSIPRQSLMDGVNLGLSCMVQAYSSGSTRVSRVHRFLAECAPSPPGHLHLSSRSGPSTCTSKQGETSPSKRSTIKRRPRSRLTALGGNSGAQASSRTVD